MAEVISEPALDQIDTMVAALSGSDLAQVFGTDGQEPHRDLLVAEHIIFVPAGDAPR
ncbi:hypothetical protein [Nonomuraea sp. NPDC050783]|uniref:hypothetical protein n=1 Tax=Nonomuraea sp. NPDC050783 TaxID=3154634 RepID=UPI003466A61F